MRSQRCARSHPSKADAADEHDNRLGGHNRVHGLSRAFAFPFHAVVYALHHCRIEAVLGHEHGFDDGRLRAGNGMPSFVPAMLFAVPCCHITLLCHYAVRMCAAGSASTFLLRSPQHMKHVTVSACTTEQSGYHHCNVFARQWGGVVNGYRNVDEVCFNEKVGRDLHSNYLTGRNVR